MKNQINFEEFLEAESKLEIKMGKIVNVERIPKNKKMIKLDVNFGGEDTKICISNIGGSLEDVSVLNNAVFPFITNLIPAERNGYMSEAMILADYDGGNLNLNLAEGYKVL